MKRVIILLTVVSLILAAFFTVVNAEELPFDDVRESHWFYSDVAKVYELGIMEGKSPSIFAPKVVMTRAEFVTLLSRIAEVDLDGMAESAAEKFTDVRLDAWFSPYVGWGAATGIVNGYTDGTFLPNNPVSRQELAVMIVRFMDHVGLKNTEDNSLIDSFEDKKSIGSWAREQVELLRLTGLVGGDENGNFNPKKTASRAEVAAIAGRYYDLANDYFNDFAPAELTLELTVAYDAVVSEADLEALLASSVENADSYKAMAFVDAESLRDKLNALGEAVRNVEVEVTFTRGEESCNGNYILKFTRESAPAPNDPLDPTPDNIGVQFFDETSGIKISDAIHFADASGNSYLSTGTGTHGGHENKLVRTPYGTFVVYLTGERNDDTHDFVWDQFKVFKVTSEGVSVVLEAEYPHSNGSCLPTIFAGDAGKLYVTVISCDNLKYHSDNLREGAWLDVYEIDAKTCEYQKYSANPDFEISKVHGYGYSQPVPDIINGKIYALYTGGGVPGYLAWFAYDIDTHTWDTECYTVETDFRLAYFYMFADGNGGFYGLGQRDILCSDLGTYLGLTFQSSGYAWDALYLFHIKDPAKEEYEIQVVRESEYEQTDEPQAAQGLGGSAYRDDKGNIHILYAHTKKRDTVRYHAVYDKDLNVIKNEELKLTNDTKKNSYTLTMTQAPDGTYYIFAVNNYMTVKAANVEIWSSTDGLTFTKLIDSIPLMRDSETQFVPQLKFITSNTRNNSTIDGTVGFLVFEYLDGEYKYYYFAVDFGKKN